MGTGRASEFGTGNVAEGGFGYSNLCLFFVLNPFVLMKQKKAVCCMVSNLYPYHREITEHWLHSCCPLKYVCVINIADFVRCLCLVLIAKTNSKVNQIYSYYEVCYCSPLWLEGKFSINITKIILVDFASSVTCNALQRRNNRVIV